MTITYEYDPRTDNLYVNVKPDVKSRTSRAFEDANGAGLVVDFDYDGNVVGVEILNVQAIIDNPENPRTAW